MSMDKYPSIFSRQMDAIAYMLAEPVRYTVLIVINTLQQTRELGTVVKFTGNIYIYIYLTIIPRARVGYEVIESQLTIPHFQNYSPFFKTARVAKKI